MSGKGFWEDEESDVFRCFGVHSSLLNGINEAELYSPNDLQRELLSSNCKQNDVIIYAPRNSGKSSAIIIAVLSTLLENKRLNFPSAVFLYPIHELAKKSYDLAQKFIKFCMWPNNISLHLVTKGAHFKEKIVQDLLFGTPENVKEFFLTSPSAEKIRYLVFEELALMISNKSQYNTIIEIMKSFKKRYRCECNYNLIFSTFSKTEDLSEFLKNYYLVDPVLIEYKLNEIELNFIKQFFVLCSNTEDKMKILVHLETTTKYPGQTVVFFNSREEIIAATKKLRERNAHFAALYGGKNGIKPDERSLVLEEFENGKIRLLLTTPWFLYAICMKNLSKIMNWNEQSKILDKTYKLDMEAYQTREQLLRGKRESLIINCIDQGHAQYFFKNKIVRDQKEYCHGKEIISSDQIKDSL